MLYDKKLFKFCKRLSLEKAGDDSVVAFRFRINLEIFFFSFSDFCFDPFSNSADEISFSGRLALEAGLQAEQ